MPTTAENGFSPALPRGKGGRDLPLLPQQPHRHRAANHDQLKAWVDYANENDAIILFDAAYERFIAEEGVPHSIFEVEGAKTCAIEFRSFSKTAGFTGARCGYTVVPKQLVPGGPEPERHVEPPPDHQVQRCVLYHPEGRRRHLYRAGQAGDRGQTLAYYQANAKLIKEGLSKLPA